MIVLIASFIKSKSGATAIEYGLLAALLSVAIIGAAGTTGDTIGTLFGNVSNTMDDAGN